MKSAVACSIWASVVVVGLSGTASADPMLLRIVYETATLGPTGQAGGVSVAPHQFVGARFEVTAPVPVIRVGGHFAGSTQGDIFAALVALSGPRDFPDSFDLSTADVLKASTIQMGNDWPSLFLPSAEFSTSLPVRLIPGWYALVVGSGLFGANGMAALPLTDIPIGRPSGFFSDNAGPFWADTELAGGRLFVAAPVPEPGTILLLSGGLAGALWRRRRVGRSSSNRTESARSEG
jgi:hypothetical protein